MNIIAKLFGRIDLSTLRLKRRKKKNRSLLSEVMDHPEDFKLEASIEGGEIIIHIKRKES